MVKLEEIRKADNSNGETIENIWNKIVSNPVSLHISRIPRDTKEKFVKLAEEQFCSDFGMTLKFLIDGLIDIDKKEIMDAINDLDDRVRSLENKNDTTNSEEKEIKMLDGTVRKIK